MLVATAGCVSMQPVFDPARFIADTKPPVVYVMKGRDAILTLSNPRVSGDTVHGTLPGEGQPVALPLRDVQNIGTVRLNRARTVLLLAGVTAAASITAIALTSSGAANNWYCDYNTPSLDGAGAPTCGPRL